MKITIQYESSWRNSFLDGSNNKPLPKEGRKFIASMTTLKKAGNYIQRSVTKDTIMGVLNRLIGEQAKLYQARQRKNYYFYDIEKNLKDSDIIDKPLLTQEMIYIRNVTGSEDQNSFTGLIKANDSAFTSNFSSELWGILWLNLDEILNLILNQKITIANSLVLDPIKVCSQLEALSSEKPLNVEGKIKEAVEKLHNIFPEINYLDTKNKIPYVSLYTSALYLQINTLKDQFDLSTTLTAKGGLSGISKRGFTKKDFMARYTTGSKKLVWGNPYLLKESKKGEGEIISMLNKASGELEIHLNISKEQAEDFNQKIINAGVSAFYLGKKGLAYVKDIRI